MLRLRRRLQHKIVNVGHLNLPVFRPAPDCSVGFGLYTCRSAAERRNSWCIEDGFFWPMGSTFLCRIFGRLYRRTN